MAPHDPEPAVGQRIGPVSNSLLQIEPDRCREPAGVRKFKMNAQVEVSIDTALKQTGQRREVRRRLSDKILAAFNHAYSVGEYEIAKQLKAALVSNEKKSGPVKELRKSYNPLAEADLWISFVNARNEYRAACEKDNGDANAVARALDAMKEAYGLWSVK